MARIPPLSDPSWLERTHSILDVLGRSQGLTIPQLARATRTGQWLLRNALAAAHPAVVELDGRWYTAAACSRRAPKSDRQVEAIRVTVRAKGR